MKRSVLRGVPVTHYAYRGYLIRWSIFTLDKPDNRVWVERGGHLICWANDVDQAKERIDALLAEPLMLCAWCLGAEERTNEATAAGRVVTHGLCAACAEKVVMA